MAKKKKEKTIEETPKAAEEVKAEEPTMERTKTEPAKTLVWLFGPHHDTAHKTAIRTANNFASEASKLRKQIGIHKHQQVFVICARQAHRIDLIEFMKDVPYAAVLVIGEERDLENPDLQKYFKDVTIALAYPNNERRFLVDVASGERMSYFEAGKKVHKMQKEIEEKFGTKPVVVG